MSKTRKKAIEEEEGSDSFCQFHIGDNDENASDASSVASSVNNNNNNDVRTKDAMLLQQRARPSSIFGHRPELCGSLPEPPPNLSKGNRARVKQSLISVPQIKCSSHFYGASAPTTPSNGQSLPSWMQHTGNNRQGSIASIDEEARDAAASSCFLSPDDAISVNSVELASAAAIGGADDGDGCHYQTSASHSAHGFARSKRSKSRLSLNLGRGNGHGEDGQRLPSPNRSPSLIPKFLRSSFSKLWSRDRKNSSAKDPNSSAANTPAVTPTNDHHPGGSGVGSPNSKNFLNLVASSFPKSASSALLKNPDNHLGSVGSAGDFSTSANSLNAGGQGVGDFVSDSPDTAEYFEQSKLDGLPVIPFAFPTSVVAERLKNKKKAAAAAGNCAAKDGQQDVALPSVATLRVKQKTPSGDSSKSEPRDIVNKNGTAVFGRQRKSRCFDDDDDVDIMAEEEGPKSLDHLESLAKRELMEESYNIYEDALSPASLGIVSSSIKNNKLKTKKKVAREPSSEEGYVEMAPNVSRNPSPSPLSNSSFASSSLSPSYSRNRHRRDLGSDEDSPTQTVSVPRARCYLSPDPEPRQEDEEHFMMDFSKN